MIKNNINFLFKSISLINSTNVYVPCSFIHLSHILSKRRKTREEKKMPKLIQYTPKAKINSSKVIDVWKNITVHELANQMEKSLEHVFEVMEYVKDSEEYDDPDSIIYDNQVIKEIIKKSGMRSKVIAHPSEKITEKLIRDINKRPPAAESLLVRRPPVVAIMGHVDHGKTTLLDSLRNTSVVESEFGGITQHIGAFKYPLGTETWNSITFLDTPGHAAFSSMRSRGAHATDMVILVVAADDGVMEQTIQSISMAKEANVPIIVAINKIDKPKADIVRTRKMLINNGILLESEGGDVQAVEISALKKTNLNELIETIMLQSEMMELRADPTGPIEGIIIEDRIDTLRGKLATTLVQRGTLRKGAILVAGVGWARVRAMFDETGKPVEKARPSDPVEIIGWRELPKPGDEVLEVESEKRANEVMRWRENEQHDKLQEIHLEGIEQYRQKHLKEYKTKLELKRSLGRYKMRPTSAREKLYVEDNFPKVNIIVKGDVNGSVEAILDVIETYDDNSNCALNLVHYGVGKINPSDIELAKTFKAIIYGFNINKSKQFSDEIKKNQIIVKHFNVIYKMIDDLKEEISSQLPPNDVEEVLGEANVLQYFEVTQGKNKISVAGCRCTKGILKKTALFRVLRNDEILFEGQVKSLKHLKNEVNSIKKDIECGLSFDNKIEFQNGDLVVCYEIKKEQDKTSWNPGF